MTDVCKKHKIPLTHNKGWNKSKKWKSKETKKFCPLCANGCK